MVIVLAGCTYQEAETEVTDIIVTTTETPEHMMELIPTHTLEPVWETFENEYENTVSGNQRLIYDGESIWYTSGSYLYFVDLETRTKQIIETRLACASIYIYYGEIYYLTNDSLNKINIETLQINTVLNAKGICEQVYKVDYGAENERFEDFILIDDLLQFRFFATSENHGEPSGIGWCKIDKLDLYSQEGPLDIEAINKIPYIELERIRTQTVIYGDDGISALTWNREGSEELELIGVTTNNIFLGEELSIKTENMFTIFTRINSYRAAVYDIEENVVLYEAFPSTDTKVNMHTFNQYGIISYYDEDENGMFINANVALIDRKNGTIYENEEINKFLSGGVDYTNLVLADYYQIGEVLYVMENHYTENFFNIAKRSLITEIDYLFTGHQFLEVPVLINIYKAEIIDGKLNFELLYKEFS